MLVQPIRLHGPEGVGGEEGDRIAINLLLNGGIPRRRSRRRSV
ncbi:MAG: hypothetical protein ACP5L2_07625 [Conexivisphaera sp.]